MSIAGASIPPLGSPQPAWGLINGPASVYSAITGQLNSRSIQFSFQTAGLGSLGITCGLHLSPPRVEAAPEPAPPTVEGEGLVLGLLRNCIPSSLQEHREDWASLIGLRRGGVLWGLWGLCLGTPGRQWGSRQGLVSFGVQRRVPRGLGKGRDHATQCSAVIGPMMPCPGASASCAVQVGFLSLAPDTANPVGSAEQQGEGRGCFIFGLFEQVRFAHQSPEDLWVVPAESTLAGLFT